MAAKGLSGLNFNSTAFLDTVKAKIADKLNFFNSGILVYEPTLATQTGYYGEVPHYDKLSGDEERIVSNTDLTVNDISQFADICVWLERAKAWGSEDWTKWVAGEEPLDEIASQVANYWARVIQNTMLQVLTGTFTTALLATHVMSDYDSGTIDLDPVIHAKKLLGDSSPMLAKAIMHSKVWYDALKAKIANYESNSGAGVDSFSTGEMPKLLGMDAFMEDALTAVADKYSTYFSAPGSLIYSIREQNTESERQPLKAAGTDVLVTRLSYTVHLPGVAWNVGTTNPTNAQLATDTNWTKVETENRNIQIVKLITL